MNVNDNKKIISKETNKDLEINNHAEKHDTFDDNQRNWEIFNTSLQGNDHIKQVPPILCQDAHAVLEIDDKWGISVVCDGAGSHKYSHYGSKYVSEYIVKTLHNSIIESKMYKNKVLLNNENWNNYCMSLIRGARIALEKYVKEGKETQTLPNDITIRNVGCTIIFVVYSDIGLLVGHIGDGRAGYRDNEGWHSMMKPFKGEYANQTIFINSDFIYENKFENKNEPENPFLETKIIRKNVDAFLLMSDGCENGLYETTIQDEETQKYKEVNRPFAPMFDYMISNLTDEIRINGKDKANEKFENFIKEGNSALKEEGDDKTLIFVYKRA